MKIWIGKGMFSKHVSFLGGLIGLVVATCCTIDGVVVGALLLVLISIDIKLGCSYLKLGKTI
jgi:hypothetical protein